MDASPSTSGLQRFFVLLGSLSLIVACLYFAQAVLIPVALAVLLTFVLAPAVSALQRRGLSRVPAVLMVVILAFAVLGGLGSMVVFQLRGLAKDLPTYRTNIRTKIAGLRDLGGEGTVLSQFQSIIKDVTDAVLEPEKANAEGPENAPVPVQVQTSGYARVQAAVGPAAEALATAGLVVVLVIFMLIQREDLRNRLVRLVGHGRLIVTTRAIDEAATRISRYLLMQLTINAGFGLALGVGLFLLGVPYAFLWGFVAGSLRFVPYVGTWLAVTLILLFAVAYFPGWREPLFVLGLFLVLELLTFNVVEPLLFGHSTGLSPLALLVAAAFWTWLWGPIGLVLSTPLTACLVVLGRYVPPLEFFAVLLGDEPALAPQVTFYQRILARDQDEATELIEEYIQKEPVENVYDHVLLPALRLAKRDRERDELTPDDEQFLAQVIRDILDDLLWRQQQIKRLASQDVPVAKVVRPVGRPMVRLLGCPARDEEDELALHMLRQVLDPADCELETLSHKTLTAEVVARVNETHPALVCITALPPGGMAQVRYLCKRLRTQFPDLKILVGRWGMEADNSERSRQSLLAAGADQVGATLLETRSQIVPLVQVLANTPDVAAAHPA